MLWVYLSSHILCSRYFFLANLCFGYRLQVKSITVFASIYICTYTKHYQNIYQTPYQNHFASTSKQGRIHSPHLIRHLPYSFNGTKMIPLHLNLLDCLVPKHEHLFLQYTLRLRLEFSIWFHLQYKPVNHMIIIFNILHKKLHMENIMDFHCQRHCKLIGYWPNPLNDI